jgi:hypothetical protein
MYFMDGSQFNKYAPVTQPRYMHTLVLMSVLMSGSSKPVGTPQPRDPAGSLISAATNFQVYVTPTSTRILSRSTRGYAHVGVNECVNVRLIEAGGDSASHGSCWKPDKRG